METTTAQATFEDASWSIGLFTNEQLERMTEAEYEAAKQAATR